jgi:hypothetical protein
LGGSNLREKQVPAGLLRRSMRKAANLMWEGPQFLQKRASKRSRKIYRNAKF